MIELDRNQDQDSQKDPMADTGEGYEESPVYHDIGRKEEKEQKEEGEEGRMDKDK